MLFYLTAHMLYTVFLQELQRRLDQTLGKPGSYLAGIDRAGNVKPMTIGARLYRVEQQVSKSQLHVTHECCLFNDSDLRDCIS
jgi:potassium voltage-gated channel KQT-like subfamily protein 1